MEILLGWLSWKAFHRLDQIQPSCHGNSVRLAGPKGQGPFAGWAKFSQAVMEILLGWLGQKANGLLQAGPNPAKLSWKLC